jgi:hypothetical protein
MKLTDFTNEKWPNDNPKSIKIDLKILNFICKSCEPLCTTEKPGFSDLFEEACPRLHFPIFFKSKKNLDTA